MSSLRYIPEPHKDGLENIGGVVFLQTTLEMPCSREEVLPTSEHIIGQIRASSFFTLILGKDLGNSETQKRHFWE